MNKSLEELESQLDLAKADSSHQKKWLKSFSEVAAKFPFKGEYLNADDFYPYIVSPEKCMILAQAVDKFLVDKLKGNPVPEKGLRIPVALLHLHGDNSETAQLAAVIFESQETDSNSHVSILNGFYGGVHSKLQPEKYPNQQELIKALGRFDNELRIPLQLVVDSNIKKQAFGNCWLYHVRFNTTSAHKLGQIDTDFSATLGRGYFGVTTRPFQVRLGEHFDDVKNGKGHLFHETWRKIIALGIDFKVIAQISGWATTEEEIYELEEQVVDQVSLYPRGLNMIPGGKRGIAELNKMGFSKATLSNRDEILEQAAITNKNQKLTRATHFRSPHLREYKPGKFTQVKGAWVNKAD